MALVPALVVFPAMLLLARRSHSIKLFSPALG
jgi:hypothetical protein